MLNLMHNKNNMWYYKYSYPAADDCIRANSDEGDRLPNFGDPGNNAPRIEVNPIQVIIKSYQFHCCGKVGEWRAYIEPGGDMYDRLYTIKFQIWRLTDATLNRYVKVGENSFPRVQVSDSRIREDLSSNEQLHFQPGDVLGYYLEQTEHGNEGGIQFDSENEFTQEELWYTTGDSDIQNECRLDIGTDGDLSLSTTLGPIISVSLCKF